MLDPTRTDPPIGAPTLPAGKKYYTQIEPRRVQVVDNPHYLTWNFQGDDSIKWLYAAEMRNQLRAHDGIIQVFQKVSGTGIHNIVIFAEPLRPIVTGLAEHVGVWNGIVPFNQRIRMAFYNATVGDIITGVICYVGEV